MLAAILFILIAGAIAGFFFLLPGEKSNRPSTEKSQEASNVGDKLSPIFNVFDGGMIKTIVSSVLIIVALAILFPVEFQNAIREHGELVAVFLVAVAILLIVGTGKDSQVFLGLAKLFAVGLVGFIIFTVIIDPNVDFDALGEKINPETNRIEQSIGQDGLGENFSQKNLPPLLRVGPHTKTSPVKISPDGRLEFVKVSIDGTNEFEKHPIGQRKGHDTTLVAEPGECVEVRIIPSSELLTYSYTDREGKFRIASDPVYGGRGWSHLTEDDSAFYEEPGTGNAVLLVFWAENEPRVFPILQAHDHVTGCNPFPGEARVFLFFNTIEKYRDRITGIAGEDAFQYNGWDGSRAVFDVKLYQET